MKSRRALQTILYLLLFSGLALLIFSSRFSFLIESLYSTKIYYWVMRPYSLLTGLFPFSLAEFIVVSIIGLLGYKLLKAVLAFYRNPRVSIRRFPKKVLRIAYRLVAIYIIFNLMWGLNYNRLNFKELSDLSVEPASISELAELSLYLTHWANELREKVKEDDRGVMMLNNGIRNMLSRSYLGYENAGEIYPKLAGRYGKPKGIILSPFWSYTGIGGVFFPFTAEANLNTSMPHFMLPSTTTHEMAHQRGFAREDEANYIAYLTSTLHPDFDFQYSGVMLALTYTMGELQMRNREIWNQIRLQYSEGLNRDLEDWKSYWDRYQGPIDNISTSINNTYLRVNGQDDGINSYNRMVELLLLDFRSNDLKGREK
jgi:hypothetical protein